MSKEISWPAWFNNADETRSAVFEKANDVPNGWTSGAEKIKVNRKSEKKDKPAEKAEVDAEGREWNEEIHVATKSKTKEGLWRLKPGASHPDPVVLDL